MANKSTRRPTAASVADRRARVAEMRKAEQAKERRRKFVVWGGGGGGVIALVVVIVLIAVMKGGSSSEVIPDGVDTTAAATTQQMPTTVTNNSGIDGVTEYNTASDTSSTDCVPATAVCHQHVSGTVKYALTPPIGGPHNPNWMNCGVYDKPVPSERAVHNLEHGAVWITYRPSLSKADVTTLQNLVKKQKNVSKTQPSNKDVPTPAKYMDLTPWASDSLPSPIVISSWGAQLKIDKANDPRLQQFIDKFRMRDDQTYEAGAACNGGLGTPLFS